MTNAEARFNKSHIRKVYACLAVTCHLHFWQNDRDFLRATVVTRGWNGYRNKSQHRKSTLEKKILPPFQQGFEPATFQSRVRRSNHWAIPAPIEILRISEYHLILHGDLNYKGNGDLKSDLRRSFHLKFQSICYTTQFTTKRMLLPQFANCFSFYRLTS